MNFNYITLNGVLQNILVLRHFLTTKALQNDPEYKIIDFLTLFYLRNSIKKRACAKIINAISPATLDRVAEEPHPS